MKAIHKKDYNPKIIKKSRLFSDSDNYWILGIHNKKVIELDHSTAEFFVNSKRSMKPSKQFEIKIK